jgi:hypothetical protein
MKTILTWLLLALTVFGSTGSFTFSWLPNPAVQNVAEYRVYRLDTGGSRALLATVATTTATVTATSGQQLVVAAYNGAEGAASLPITVWFPADYPTKKLVLQASSDLKNWTSYSQLELPATDQTYQFLRLKIETP